MTSKRLLLPIRGMPDLFPGDVARLRRVETCATEVVRRFGFQEVRTPMLELTEAFERPLGADSDVVSKEMYTFLTRGGYQATLRPEGTTGLMRAILANSTVMHAGTLKYYYCGPMFRYERPQRGRQRQFHQFGVETIGQSLSWMADLEQISVASLFLKELGVLSGTKLLLNTLGDDKSRENYRNALRNYLQTYKDKLSPDSQARLERGNPLRVLDSKAPEDKDVIVGAPAMDAFMTPEARTFFDQLRNGLDEFQIAYTVDPKLVRGLDYYTHSVFEFVTDKLGAQSTVLAGGRYDGLAEIMGGPRDRNGVGWAAGLERLVLLREQMGLERRTEHDADVGPRAIAIIVQDDGPRQFNQWLRQRAMRMANELRQRLPDRPVLLPPDLFGTQSKLRPKTQFQWAQTTLHASHGVVLRAHDTNVGQVSIHHLTTGQTSLVGVHDAQGRFIVDNMLPLLLAD